MTRILLLLSGICSLLAWVIASDALADYYRYTDSRGVINMTNKLDSVPAKYRSKVTVIPESAPAKSEVQQPEPAAEEKAPSSQPAQNVPVLERYPWLKVLAYLALMTGALWAIARACRLLPSRALGKLLCTVLSLGLLLFLFNSYSDHAVSIFHKLKQDATSLIEKSHARQQSLPRPQDEPQ